MHTEGKGIKIIADALTTHGHRSRRDAPMNKATVGEWFRNPYPFAGCVVWNTRDHKLKPKPKSEWVIVEEAYPALITMEVAEVVGAFQVKGDVRIAGGTVATGMHQMVVENQLSDIIVLSDAFISVSS